MSFTLTSCQKEDIPLRQYQATLFSNCDECKQVYAVVRNGKTVYSISNIDIRTGKVFALQQRDVFNANIFGAETMTITVAVWSEGTRLYQDEIQLTKNEWKRFNFALP